MNDLQADCEAVKYMEVFCKILPPTQKYSRKNSATKIPAIKKGHPQATFPIPSIVDKKLNFAKQLIHLQAQISFDESFAYIVNYHLLHLHLSFAVWHHQ